MLVFSFPLTDLDTLRLVSILEVFFCFSLSLSLCVTANPLTVINSFITYSRTGSDLYSSVWDSSMILFQWYWIMKDSNIVSCSAHLFTMVALTLVKWAVLLNHHISVKNHPILIKFGTLQQIMNPMTVTWPFLKFKMAAAAIFKIGFLAIIHRSIVRFQRNFVRGSRTACWRGLRDKKCKRVKFKMADGRHFKNR